MCVAELGTADFSSIPAEVCEDAVIQNTPATLPAFGPKPNVILAGSHPKSQHLLRFPPGGGLGLLRGDLPPQSHDLDLRPGQFGALAVAM
jgi:hypothetical protein